MKLLKAFLIFFIVFGASYFFTGFYYGDFNYINWQKSSRTNIIVISLFITYSVYYFKLIQCLILKMLENDF